ncbi:branched-chain amino acid ABC transporter substrate-binding protein [Allobranchiibius sp. CTAmp26]|uniref:branched-chain amino acid ABC transporter substrate-binding protein n=1 Tax=Allobranchiibius sp. CTAmp26 TaxID=2815214 RepID=UPI001AA1D077|nr:branched-chain amino acid ABC transporter substrate-binding protein [Allobranchiibius sp. CTAmp26]MBO1754345.1 branched-chain amino acid ABC transporter substrate-binding protein [Allobranchiibius sp. CTAmp26]
MRSTLIKVGVPVVAGALALSACGSRSGGGSSSGSSDGGSGKVATIGVTAPFTGDLSAVGLGIENSVKLAVQQANAKKVIPGWTLKVDAEDDQGKPEVGTNAATKLAGDPTVVGVVGNLNSSVSTSTQPIFSRANIVQVSPANTGVALTNVGGKRPYATYFRTCTTDAIQGPFAAKYLISQGIKKVATINDQKTYGAGLTAAFEKEFKKEGGTITASQTITDAQTNYSSVISQIKPGAPKALYYGGEYPQAGPLSKQLAQGGLAIPVMGGDGIYDPKYIQLGGRAADLATSVGAPTDSTTAGKAFLAQYKAAKFNSEAGGYGAYAFDAANAIIEALKTSLKDAKTPKDARAATVKAMANVNITGVTGKVAFDKFGDTTNKVLTVYKVTGGAWVAAKTDTF